MYVGPQILFSKAIPLGCILADERRTSEGVQLVRVSI